MRSVWDKVDAGLYASPFGNIIREHDGWWAFRDGASKGPFSTLWSAKSWAERNPLRAKAS